VHFETEYWGCIRYNHDASPQWVHQCIKKYLMALKCYVFFPEIQLKLTLHSDKNPKWKLVRNVKLSFKPITLWESTSKLKTSVTIIGKWNAASTLWFWHTVDTYDFQNTKRWWYFLLLAIEFRSKVHLFSIFHLNSMIRSS
jgi:hypothetical protein